jgi:hypothetical protein
MCLVCVFEIGKTMGFVSWKRNPQSENNLVLAKNKEYRISKIVIGKEEQQKYNKNTELEQKTYKNERHS